MSVIKTENALVDRRYSISLAGCRRWFKDCGVYASVRFYKGGNKKYKARLDKVEDVLYVDRGWMLERRSLNDRVGFYSVIGAWVL